MLLIGIILYLQSTPVVSKSKRPVLFVRYNRIRYKGSNISVIKAIGKNIHFDISGYFVIT